MNLQIETQISPWEIPDSPNGEPWTLRWFRVLGFRV